MAITHKILLPLLLLAGLSVSASNAPQSRSTADPDSYDISSHVSNADGRSTWTYTITKTADNAKDLGHFIVSFDACGDRSPTLDNIVSATVNGMDWMHHIERTDGKSGCGVDSANFVKFDNLPSADTYVIEFTLDDIYAAMDSTGWLKSGRRAQKRRARARLQRVRPHVSDGSRSVACRASRTATSIPT